MNVTVTAVNDTPVVTAGSAQVVDEGTSVTVTATYSDVDAGDTHTAAVNWGDGSLTASLGPVSGDTVSASHTYADNGTYTATITITDNGTTAGNSDPKSGSAGVSVIVKNVAPVVAMPTVTVNPTTGVATLTSTFTDVGTPDTFPAGSFSVITNGTPPVTTVVTGTVVRNIGGGGNDDGHRPGSRWAATRPR